LSVIDCLFVNPRSNLGVLPYPRTTYAAAVLRSKDINCDILDPAASGLTDQEIVEHIDREEVKIVCISVLPSTLQEAYSLITLLKERSVACTIVCEGYMINADPSSISQLNVPFGLIGDYEFSFAELCMALLNGQPVNHDLEGLVINENGHLNVNPYAIIKVMDRLPDPAFDLMPIGKYFTASSSKRYMAFSITRGCPYKCNFCANAAQMSYRHFSSDRVIGQLEELISKHKVERIEFLDLTFTINRKRTEELCGKINERQLVFEWGCQSRVDLVDRELLETMYQAGCRKIAFGVESGSSLIRERSDKKIGDDRFREIFSICREIGIQTMAYFVFGHPGESKKDMKKTLRFALNIKAFNVVFIRMMPLPDVDIFQQGLSEGLYTKDLWFEFMRGEREHPLYHPPTLTQKEIDRFYKYAYIRYYFSPRTIINYLPLFANPMYFLKTVKVFFKLVFGSTKAVYCS